MASVDEYAKWRGITPQRVRELLRSGELPGRRIGSRQWIVDDAAFASRPRIGRPMSPPMAWSLIALLGGDEPVDELSPVQWSRLREYRNRVLHAGSDAPAMLSSWLRHRGERVVYRASPEDLADLAKDARLLPSGVSDSRAGISAAGTIEAWLRHFMSLEQLVGEYLLLPDPKGQVVLHRGREHGEDRAPLGMIIADLADWNGPREDARVVELLATTR